MVSMERLLTDDSGSYLSGQTYYQGQHGSPEPDMQHSQHSTPPAHSYYGHLSHGSHGSYAPAQPVELPLSYPTLQEMPAPPSPGVARFSAQMGLGQDQRLPTSLEPTAVSSSTTPMSSPRFPDEAAFSQQPPGSSGNYYYQGGGRSYGR